MGQSLLKITPAGERLVRPKLAADGTEFLVTARVPNAHMTTAGHLSLAVLFYALLIAYFIVTLIADAAQPPLHTRSLRSSGTDLPPLLLTVRPRCAVGPCGVFSVAVNYSTLAAARAADCLAAGGLGTSLATRLFVSMDTELTIPLCRVADSSFTTSLRTGTPMEMPGVVLSFHGLDSTNGTGEVLLSTTPHNYSRQLSMSTGHVKSLTLLGSKRVLDGQLAGITLIDGGYHTEGLRLDNVSDVLVQLGAFAQHDEITTTKSVFRFLADCGSAFEFVKMMFVVVIPVWCVLFAATNVTQLDGKYVDGNDRTQTDGSLGERTASARQMGPPTASASRLTHNSKHV